MSERIQKILSAHGLVSRREAERMIQAGRVTVDGIPATIGQSADADLNVIEVDNVRLAPAGKHVYLMLNKPKGYVTTMRDERNRKTVAGLVSGAGVRVYPVGRLDMDSEGLLLMTNDGHFANIVSHPSNNKVKTYEISVRGETRAAVRLLKKPVTIDTHTVKAVFVELSERTIRGGIITMGIIEGRNRQVRKMCALCGLEVTALKRTAIDTVRLGSLETGRWRYLTETERLTLLEGNH